MTVINKTHLLGVWSGLIFLITYMLGLWFFADFVPAHSPSETAAEILNKYQSNRAGIKAGMIFVMFASSFYLVWTVMWSSLLKRMENGSDFLSGCQLIGGVASSMFFILPALVWQTAAFRADNSAEIVLALNDLGWILTVTPTPPFLVQFIPVGLAILLDKSSTPVLPRWFGFATLWACVLYTPAVIAYFFADGPFAWNGIFPFWIPLSTFIVWMLVAFWLSLKAVNKLSLSE